jgi:hypothetical protein
MFYVFFSYEEDKEKIAGAYILPLLLQPDIGHIISNSSDNA